MRISDWSSDVCSSDLDFLRVAGQADRLDDGADLQRLPRALHRQILDQHHRIAVAQQIADRVADLGGRRRGFGAGARFAGGQRSEEHTSELQSLMRISYAVFCLKKKKIIYANI